MRRRGYKRFKPFNFRLNSKLAWRGSLIFCCLILLVGLGYAIYTASIFKIKREGIKDPENILSRDLKMRIEGQSLFSLDIQAISSSLLKANPEYKAIYVYREFPSSLIVEAVKRIPFAQIKERKFYPVDKEAIIISDGVSQPLEGLIPLEISGYSGSFKKGDSVASRRLKLVFDLIDALADEGILKRGEVKLINANSLEAIDFIFVGGGFRGGGEPAVDTGIKVIVGKDDFRRKLKVLGDLMDNELEGKMASLKYIDLRFKKVYMDFKR